MYTGKSIFAALFVPALMCAGCSASPPVGFDEAIFMGPFEFEVSRAAIAPPDGGHPAILVEFKVLNDTSKGEIPFDLLMNDLMDAEGNENKSMFLKLSMALVDSHGHRFVGSMKKISGKWWGKFIIWELSLRDQEGFDRVHRNLPIEDFSLVMKNPGPQKGQSRKVSIPFGEE